MDMDNVTGAYDYLKAAHRELNSVFDEDEQFQNKAKLNAVLANIVQAENCLLALRESLVKRELTGNAPEG